MNTNLLNVLKQIVSQYGPETLADARRVKALLADLAAGEPKPQKNALIASLEQGFAALLQNVPANERGPAKIKLAERLNREEGLDRALCADTLDLLEAVLFESRENSAGGSIGCPSCGGALPQGARFCPFCGIAVASGTPEVAQPASRKMPQHLPQDLAEVFGAKGVTATFNAVHAFLQTCNGGSVGDRWDRIVQRIIPGDWIDLPHLMVQGDAGGRAIITDNIDLGENGTLLRLIVAGIDSFAVTNKDAPAHIVFQFQNIPGHHRMNASNTNSGGYKESEIRHYLTSSFLRGLLSAGVPEGVLYAPTRYIANSGESATAADALADWLWLPTEWEVFGKNDSSNRTWETAANQARLEYYEGRHRIKYNTWWWEASPFAGSSASFAGVHGSGNASYSGASGVGGCVPAFCVR